MIVLGNQNILKRMKFLVKDDWSEVLSYFYGTIFYFLIC